MASISVLAIIQFVFLNHMPGWETSIHGMSSQRMINFRLIGDGSYAVAEYYAVESPTQDKIDFSLSILDVERGQKYFEVKEPGLTSARVSPDLQLLALGYRDGTVKIRKLDGSANDLNLSHSSLGRSVRDVHWSPDSTRLLLAYDTTNDIVDLSGVVLSTISTMSIAPIVCPEDSNYFCLANQGYYRLYEWQTGREVAELPIEASVRSLTFSSNLRYCACLRGCDLMVFDLVAWKSTWSQPIKSPWSTKTAIAFSPDERSIAIVKHDETLTHRILVFDIETECELSSYEVQMDYIAGIVFCSERLWAWTTSGKVSHLMMKQSEVDSKFTVLLENVTAFQ
ncbi:MAG: hypothetical protein U0930_22085 [Pirellulales bacterium]